MQELTKSDDQGLRFLIELVCNSVDAEKSRYVYRRMCNQFFDWWLNKGRPPLAKATVGAYKAELMDAGFSAATTNLALVVVRKIVDEAYDNGLCSAEVMNAVHRVRGVKRKGVKLKEWLNRDDAQKLLNHPPAHTLRGVRDRCLLSAFLGCALRRAEAASLTWDQIQVIDGRGVIVNVLGKGSKFRSIPMTDWTKKAFDDWHDVCGYDDGPIFRSVLHGDLSVGKPIGPSSLWNIVIHHSDDALGRRISPHCLRRTAARLMAKNGANIAALSGLLGHADIRQTSDYVGAWLETKDPPTEHLGIWLEGEDDD